jgi:hypothetical protein
MVPTGNSDAEVLLAKKLAHEDHIMKSQGDVLLMMALDRFASPAEDPRRRSRMKAGIERFKGWFVERSQADQSKKFSEEMGGLKKDFIEYINTWVKLNEVKE